MKTTTFISAAILFAGIVMTGCSEEKIRIEGSGPVVTRTLPIDSFHAIEMVGKDNVYITYGPEQEVTVEGQANIISRIRHEVRNGTWIIELENGNYGQYELTYYLTLPALERVVNTGTGNTVVDNFIAQEDLEVTIVGTGDFRGFPMEVRNCIVDISGTGDCEVTVQDHLEVTIEGTGDVFYKGHPLLDIDITGSGTVNDSN